MSETTQIRLVKNPQILLQTPISATALRKSRDDSEVERPPTAAGRFPPHVRMTPEPCGTAWRMASSFITPEPCAAAERPSNWNGSWTRNSRTASRYRPKDTGGWPMGGGVYPKTGCPSKKRLAALFFTPRRFGAEKRTKVAGSNRETLRRFLSSKYNLRGDYYHNCPLASYAYAPRYRRGEQCTPSGNWARRPL